MMNRRHVEYLMNLMALLLICDCWSMMARKWESLVLGFRWRYKVCYIDLVVYIYVIVSDCEHDRQRRWRVVVVPVTGVAGECMLLEKSEIQNLQQHTDKFLCLMLCFMRRGIDTQGADTRHGHGERRVALVCWFADRWDTISITQTADMKMYVLYMREWR